MGPPKPTFLEVFMVNNMGNLGGPNLVFFHGFGGSWQILQYELQVISPVSFFIQELFQRVASCHKQAALSTPSLPPGKKTNS